MYGQTVPGGLGGIGADSYLDVGFDSQYQYDGQQYSVTLKLSDVMEFQKFNASFATGGASNVNDKLNSFKANATFVWDHTYSLTAGYFNVSGTGDQTLGHGGLWRQRLGQQSERQRDDLRCGLPPIQPRRPGTIQVRQCARRRSIHDVLQPLRRKEQLRWTDREPRRGGHSQRLGQQHAAPLCLGGLLTQERPLD
jgi:hypothetical protein